MEHSLEETQKNINKVKGIFSRLKNRFFRSSTSKREESQKSSKKKLVKSTFSSFKIHKSNKIPVETEYTLITGSDREKEIHSNLDDISSGLTELKSLANGMNNELNRQDELIDVIYTKTDKVHSVIKDQDEQISKIK